MGSEFFLYFRHPNVYISVKKKIRFIVSFGFSALFAGISYFKFSEFEEFNKTIIPLALVGYETGYSQLGATRLVGYLPSHIQHAFFYRPVNLIVNLWC